MNVDHQRVPIVVKKGYKGKKKIKEDPLKVVYISSPMKVKTSASRFRSLVQELTGKNSDISQYMDDSINYGASDIFQEIDCDDHSLGKETSSDLYQTYSSISPNDTSTSSDSMSNVYTSQIRDQFGGIFSSNSFYDPSQLDVLGSFDELL
ncbi:hypothetical protein C2S53_004618 [Perilla frutescens var. hirtella]|uniref:VQ domain-containing protein n=1 Tax=Perilla frutescens var. hirtella TaxID=608512 RepID=A0AAD4JJM3_PERFH|nr:hypothetical protein C2S53_004618 [Perilla frutescens var. hirtella]